MRKIIHIDMDAFFASIEQRDNPTLRNKAVVVGGMPNSRGVVSTASYEARQFGIHSAMSSAQAYRLCPQAIFIPPRMRVYREVSQKIHAILKTITPIVEPLSLDEAYLDVSTCTQFQSSATLIAQYLRAQIAQETGLTASAGVSYNKMLAKIASDINKPDGIAVIHPNEAAAFIATLPIEKFHGIGKATAKKMRQLGIHNGATLRAADATLLRQHFGKLGEFYHRIANGQDNRPVNPTRQRQSYGLETTFVHDIQCDTDILAALCQHNRAVLTEIKRRNLHPRTITIKIRYSDFSRITRSHSVRHAFIHQDETEFWIKKLYNTTPKHLPVRLVGVAYSNFKADILSPQLSLFE